MKPLLVPFTVLMIAALAAWPGANADTLVHAGCAVVHEGPGTFEMTACGEDVSFSMLRLPASATVVMSVTTDLGSMTCTWQPNEAGSCDGDSPEATPGSTVVFVLSVTEGTVLFEANSTPVS